MFRLDAQRIGPRRPRGRDDGQREQRDVALLRQAQLGGGGADGGAQGAVQRADGDLEVDDARVGLEGVVVVEEGVLCSLAAARKGERK